MLAASGHDTTPSRSTSHISAILRFRPSGTTRSQRSTTESGTRPIERSSATECCVGFVFNSPDGPRYGTSDTCR